MKEFLLKHIRVKTLAVSWHVCWLTYLLTEGTNFINLLLCLITGASLQAVANLYNSSSSNQELKRYIWFLVATSFVAGGIVAFQKPGLWAFAPLAYVLAFGYSRTIFSTIKVSESFLGTLLILVAFGPFASLGVAIAVEGANFFENFIAGFINAIFAHNLLWIHHLKDLEKDKAAGKKTIPALLGEKKSLTLFVAENAFGVLFVNFYFGLPQATVILVFVTILAWLIMFKDFLLAFHYWVFSLLIFPFVFKLVT